MLDDYIHTCLTVLNNVPSMLLLSPQFPQSSVRPWLH